MFGRERRDRFRRDYSPRSEGGGGRNAAPPSRHLWIGNLSHHIHESELSEQCLRFGELESVAFMPGRSYAFVNFRKEEDAMIAMTTLQGFNLAGLPLKIEFAKAERSLASSHDEYQQRRDERRSIDQGIPFQREARARPISPETLYGDKSRTGDKNAEPTEVLWIGFPSFLNVDEMLLRESFSPFGEIEKITAFPGRSYAFVQFRSVSAACRAKEALQGKLFNNPRVSICFAKREMNSHEQGRNSMNPPFSPHFRSNGHPGRPIEFQQDGKFGSSTGEPYGRYPRFNSDFEPGDSDSFGFNRKTPLWSGAGKFEPMSFQRPRTQLGIPDDSYERLNTPERERGPPRHDFSPGKPPRKNPFHEDFSGMHGNFGFHEAKKLKTGPFPPQKELPEYPFSESAQDKHHPGLSMPFPNLPEHGTFDKNFVSGPFSSNRIVDRPHPLNERHDKWDTPYERFETGSGSGSLPPNPVNRKVSAPESRQSPLKDVWKWEGTIAKGGTPVCRARCFPVGKSMDFMLPGLLDCTARTGLDMLAKHFFQAASSWVVFFVPESDADIALYNEFMHYLGEKQRAAVAKLGEKTTLFLVPPSEFSEKILKVPGKLSISGVILRFQDPSSEFGSLNQPLEAMDSKLPSVHEGLSYPKPQSNDLRPPSWGPSQSNTNLSSEPFPSSTSFATRRKPELNDLPFLENMPVSASSESISGSTHLPGRGSEAFSESRYYQPLQHQHSQVQSNWSPHLQNLNPSTGSLPPQVSSSALPHSSDTIKKDNSFMKPEIAQETSSSQIGDSNQFLHQQSKPQVSTSFPVPSLQPEQLAHLASLLVQKQQSGNGLVVPLEEGHKQPFLMNQSQNPSQTQVHQFAQVHQLLQQKPNAPTSSQSSPNLQIGTPQSQGNQPLQNTNAREDPNPHTRLQATLQLAATLLQQIQQQSRGPDQL